MIERGRRAAYRRKAATCPDGRQKGGADGTRKPAPSAEQPLYTLNLIVQAMNFVYDSFLLCIAICAIYAIAMFVVDHTGKKKKNE